MKLNHPRGFNVIELMAVVAIVAALATVAMTTYRSYVKKARTAEAMVLLSGAQVAEKSFFQGEKAYTLCLVSIMGIPTTRPRYYAVGFNLPPPPTAYDKLCGPASGQDCHQKCFSNPARCKNAPDPYTHDSGDNGIAFASTAFSQNVDFYGAASTGLSGYPSTIAPDDFQIVAATDEALFAQNDVLEKLLPSAFAATWKVYAIGPTGGPYERSAFSSSCRIQCACLNFAGDFTVSSITRSAADQTTAQQDAINACKSTVNCQPTTGCI